MSNRFSIKSIHPVGVLSFGETTPIELGQLNVLIGPNASGKSNFIELFRILRSLTEKEMTQVFREGGGGEDYIFKGQLDYQNLNMFDDIEISLVFNKTFASQNELFYNVGFSINKDSQAMLVGSEILRENKEHIEESQFYYSNFFDEAFLYRATGRKTYQKEQIEDDLNLRRSILSQVNDRRSFPEVHRVADYFSRIAVYDEFQTTRGSAVRWPQVPDMPSDALLKDGSNLSIIVNTFSYKYNPEIIEKYIRQIYPDFSKVVTRFAGGLVQLAIFDTGLGASIPASRLSDGTLRFLCLVTILAHPEPPPMICIEEPEAGLHPDMINVLAELLIEASTRTQVIITTHSDLLVSAIGKSHPESIVICARDEKGTAMHRLDPGPLEEWLAKYSLGELWLQGHLGGTRE